MLWATSFQGVGMFHKGKVGYDYLREVVAYRIHWLDCRIAKWNLDGKCSDQGIIM